MTVREFEAAFPKSANGEVYVIAKKTNKPARVVAVHTTGRVTVPGPEVSAVTIAMSGRTTSKTLLLKSFLKDYKAVPQEIITPNDSGANPGDLTVKAWNHIGDRILTGLASRNLITPEVIAAKVAARLTGGKVEIALGPLDLDRLATRLIGGIADELGERVTITTPPIDPAVLGELVADKIAAKLGKVVFTKNFVTTLAREMRRQNASEKFVINDEELHHDGN